MDGWVCVKEKFVLDFCYSADICPCLEGESDLFQDPLSCFSKFFPRSVFEHVSEKTNRYAGQWLDITYEFPRRTRYRSWTGCKAEDIQSMVALEIAMGMCRKPSLEL